MDIKKAYSKEELEKLQDTLFEIILEIERICKKHDIPYFAVSGTLLGVVRHKNFIPWDDDADLGMLRSDYDRFIEIAKKELSDKYILVNYEAFKDVPFVFTKIMKKDTLFVEDEVKKLDYPHLVFVDLMPLDYCPEDPKKRQRFIKKGGILRQFFKSKTLWGVSKLSKNRQTFLGRMGRKILHILLLPIPKSFIYKKMMKHMTKYNTQKTSFLIHSVAEKTANQFSEIFPLKTGTLRNLLISIPNKYEDTLSKEYGDYMMLPPEEKRKAHMPCILKL